MELVVREDMDFGRLLGHHVKTLDTSIVNPSLFKFIRKTRSLRALTIRDTPFNLWDLVESFAEQDTIHTLRLLHCGLETIDSITQLIDANHNIRTLVLDGNRFHDIQYLEIRLPHCPHLEYLSLKDNPLTPRDMNALKTLQKEWS